MIAIGIFSGTLIVGLALIASYRALRRAAERRQRRRLIETHYQIFTRRGPSHLVPVGVGVVQLVFLALMNAGDLQRVHIWDSFASLVAVPLVVFALGTHGLPQHNRTAKYVALCLGTFWGLIGMVAEEKYSAWVFGFFPMSLFAGSTLSYLLRNLDWAQDRVALLTFAIHRIYMALGPALNLRAIFTFRGMVEGGALPGYLMLRYFIRPYVRQRPFLYLRSFADDSARTFFGKVLAPSVGSRGVVISLIHEHQTGEELNRNTDDAWRAEVFALPDSTWQAWVQDRLCSCTGVVIDMSIMSGSVAWEFEQARQHLPLDRMLVVSRTPVPNHIAATGVTILYYALDSHDQRRRAVAKLLAWADHAIRHSLGSAPAGQSLIAAPMSLLLVVVVAILLWVGTSIVVDLVHTSFLVDLMLHPTMNGKSALGIHQVWMARQQVAQAVSALLFMIASPLFPLDGSSSVRSSRLWLTVPCALVGASSLVERWAGTGTGLTIAAIIGREAFCFAIGYIMLNCVCAHVQKGADAKLDAVILALLAPLLARSLQQIAMSPNNPELLWFGVLLTATTEVVTAVVFLAFIRSATLLRSTPEARSS
jgi:hypothetical protein